MLRNYIKLALRNVVSANPMHYINKYCRLLTIVRLKNMHRSERHSSISGK